jgi:pimeloyl-ACP methyl ester carboxylesterase
MPNHKRFAINGETVILDDQVRSSAPGQFIQLSDGMTFYEISGPENGKPIVFINGYSISSHLWDHNFAPLAEAGFRVLRFDFFGRGYSDRPDIEYGADLFDRQLSELIHALKIACPINLIGSSMGGAVAAIFADRHPEQVDKLILIDPAGMMPPPTYPTKFMHVPVLGEVVLHAAGNRFIIPGMEQDLLHPENHPEYISNYIIQMKFIGFKRAILSTMRSQILYSQHDTFKRVGQQDRSILLLWGREDFTIPLYIGEQIKGLLPQAVFRVIDDAGHVPHYECPNVVNPIVIDFLRA